MSFFKFFRPVPKSASLAKDRLSVIVSRERTGTRSGSPDYLHRLQQDLLAVLARYEKIDLQNVSVALDRSGDRDVLELNIVLPGGATAPGSGGSATPSVASA